MLTVIAPITSVSISTGGNQAIDGDSFTMTCNIVGDPSSIHRWKNRTSVRLDNRTHVSFDNRTLAFNPVQHSDYGEYQCMARNSVSNRTSTRYTLLVNYGPMQPVIAGAPIAEREQRVTFNCSSSSQPLSQFSWFFNGSQVATGSVYETGPLTLASHGEYTCVAFNNVTVRNSTVSKMLTIIEAITSVMVKRNKLPIASDNLTLTCEVTGRYDTIDWMKDNRSLVLNNNLNSDITISNNSLHFSPVKVSNDGNYQCVATNLFGPHISPKYQLLVNYGPLSVNISGPGLVVIGSVINANLKCSADSRPTSEYWWKYINKSLPATGPLMAVGISLKNARIYTCVAKNPLTNISMSKTISLDVTGPSPVPPFQSRVV
ncbi:cell adhesion molecule CEACAM5-like isoform X1 [Salvelinus sp. IW2-2015]|uniref:cell adhesion molecule CEACAM5-like isoform X1 n=1 Tax=Salvelinus sp. IW2-2015 TaxID=2691554 RepID=UPI0038D46FB9